MNLKNLYMILTFTAASSCGFVKNVGKTTSHEDDPKQLGEFAIRTVSQYENETTIAWRSSRNANAYRLNINPVDCNGGNALELVTKELEWTFFLKRACKYEVKVEAVLDANVIEEDDSCGYSMNFSIPENSTVRTASNAPYQIETSDFGQGTWEEVIDLGSSTYSRLLARQEEIFVAGGDSGAALIKLADNSSVVLDDALGCAEECRRYLIQLDRRSTIAWRDDVYVFIINDEGTVSAATFSEEKKFFEILNLNSVTENSEIVPPNETEKKSIYWDGEFLRFNRRIDSRDQILLFDLNEGEWFAVDGERSFFVIRNHTLSSLAAFPVNGPESVHERADWINGFDLHAFTSELQLMCSTISPPDKFLPYRGWLKDSFPGKDLLGFYRDNTVFISQDNRLQFGFVHSGSDRFLNSGLATRLWQNAEAGTKVGVDSESIFVNYFGIYLIANVKKPNEAEARRRIMHWHD